LVYVKGREREKGKRDRAIDKRRKISTDGLSGPLVGTTPKTNWRGVCNTSKELGEHAAQLVGGLTSLFSSLHVIRVCPKEVEEQWRGRKCTEGEEGGEGGMKRGV
jgi:hypothetical protein